MNKHFLTARFLNLPGNNLSRYFRFPYYQDDPDWSSGIHAQKKTGMNVSKGKASAHESQKNFRPVFGLLFILFLALVLCSAPACAVVLQDYNYIFVTTANDGGVKYNPFADNTYNIRFEGSDRGLNALHISTDPAVNFGQVTNTVSQSGTFYATDSGGKGYEDEILLLVAVNGTIPDDFSLRIISDGYTWTPNPERNKAPALATVTYQPVALDETFTKSDFIYGPQVWKPSGNGINYPIFAGQDMADTENTFQLMFVDLNAGLLAPNAALVNQGAVRINYSFQNLDSLAVFNVYGYCKNPNNGDNMVAWTNSVLPDRAMSGYSVVGIPATPVLTIPGQPAPPTDPDHDGKYEDMNGNGRKDFNDIFIFFKQMTWISINEPVSLFDFNNNGRIDFNDIFILFKEV
jgi:PKD repeat protein